MKICKFCNTQREDSDFKIYSLKCKLCRKIQRKEYYIKNRGKELLQCKIYALNNKEKLLEKARKHYEKNKTKRLEQCKRYRENNKEKDALWRKQYCKINKERITEEARERRRKRKEKIDKEKLEYYLQNKDRIDKEKEEILKIKKEKHKIYMQEYKKKYFSNPENKRRSRELEQIRKERNKEIIAIKRREYMKNRLKNNLNFKLASKLRQSLFISIKKIFKKSSAIILLGCLIEDFKIFIEKKFQSGMTWENWGKGENKWNLDHILPISLFDLEDYNQQKICFHYTNFQPLWEKDNLSKSGIISNGINTKNLTNQEKLKYLKFIGLM